MIIPPFLNRDSNIHIVTPARKVSVEDIQRGTQYLENIGFRVSFGKNTYGIHNQFGGTDQERLDDFQAALDNPNIDAILCARGGYGGTRFVDELNLSKFKENPKWIAGFSDNTSIHNLLAKNNIASIHSSVPLLIGREESKVSDQALINTLLGTEKGYTFNSNQKYDIRGNCISTITGGNLTLVCNTLGTKTEIDTRNKILFLEDVNENHYHIDRMITHLFRAGKFDNISGIIIGQFSDMKDTKAYFGKNVIEIIKERVPDNTPLISDFSSGHIPNNLPLIFGKNVELNITESEYSITYL